MLSESALKTNQKRKQFLREAKNVPCAICGKRYHFAAMDFHHKDRSTKKFLISHMGNRSLKSLKLEIAKCDVICSNCHRIRTFEYSENKKLNKLT